MDIGLKGKIIKAVGTNAPEEKGHPQNEAEIANTVDDEGLVTSKDIAPIFTVEADQQIGAEAHTFPSQQT